MQQLEIGCNIGGLKYTQTDTQSDLHNKTKDKDKDKTSSSSVLATVDKLSNPKSEEEEKIFDLKLMLLRDGSKQTHCIQALSYYGIN